MIGIITTILLVVAILFSSTGIRIVRPMEKATIERLGRYDRPANDGFNWIIPIIEKMVYQDITERMMDIEPFEAITQERLNTRVDLVVFYKVKEDDKSIFKSLYRVSNFESQIVRIAQTTARDIIGKISFDALNSKRDTINKQLVDNLKKQSDAWGVDIVRVETKEISPPQDVQESMNKVLKAQNEKKASFDLATAVETQADGKKRALIKEAEGIAQGRLTVAEAKAKAIKVVNESARKYFKGNAQLLRKFEVIEGSLTNNSKIVLGSDAKSVLKLFDLNK
jgi:regulator of protease activity HflC (stomatin/prohibitin superfamily)